MNSDRIIGILLLVLLAGWFVWNTRQPAPQPQSNPPAATQRTNQPAPATPTTVPETPQETAPAGTEETVTLQSDELALTFTTRGAALKHALLKQYRTTPAPDSHPVALDFARRPALLLGGIPGLSSQANFTLAARETNSILFTARTPKGLEIRRKYTLQSDYRILLEETLSNQSADPIGLADRTLSLGEMALGDSKNEQLGVDTFVLDSNGRGDCVRTLPETAFTGRKSSFGCSSGGVPAATFPLEASCDLPGIQRWTAVKSRFFTQLYVAEKPVESARLFASRKANEATLKVGSAWAVMRLGARTIQAGETVSERGTLYLGPKKLSLLKGLQCGADELMDFGWFWWMCVILLPVLNFFHSLVPNYGVAIILLTFLVRIIFWPLTHKSTESMKRMGALQPKLKALQEQFKDDPRKLQMETMRLYREHKVNPLSSCLPMLVQIPVFIALFTVLRSAVELRYAPFLWISDLSEPENLLAGYLPIGLNIWPILMTLTMFLQSYLSPRMGDPAQQRMMMVMMPLMMLFMFYSMPSALCLYWTVSQVLSIIQLLHRRWQERRERLQPATP